MKRVTWVCAAALVALSACSTSNVNPNASISITGSFLKQDGSPASGANVSLMRQADLAEGLAAFSSVGLECLADKRTLSTCSHGTNSTLDSQGRFTFKLKGSDTQGFLGNAATLDLTSVLPRSGSEYDGAATTIRFQVQVDALEFPLRFWQPTVDAVVNAQGVRVSWSELPSNVVPSSIPLSRLSYDVTFDTPQADGVWTQPAQQGSITVDPRVLEDSSGTLAVVAHANAVPVPDILGRAVDIILRSARFAYQGPAGAPESRGASCAMQLGDNSLVYQTQCTLTNGTFDHLWFPPAQPSVGATGQPAAVIDLGRSKPVSFVVVRGCSTGCAISISDDAHTWRQVVDPVSVDNLAATIAGTPSARYVRVQGQSVTSLRQVSVWGGPVTVPPKSILGAGPSALSPVARAAAGKSHKGILFAVALLMLAIGLLAGVAFQRKRSS
ncbi:MAG: discoidin domain-containing protein [Actinomycetota bacterium]